MQEYVKITQTNQEMLGRMSIEGNFEPVFIPPYEPKEVPILTGYVEPISQKEQPLLLK
jgi:hypothetical protein